MLKLSIIPLVLLASLAAVRADLTVVEQISTTNRTTTDTLEIRGDKMRMGQPGGMSVIVDLKTRDSITLLTNKMFIEKPGKFVLWEMQQEEKHTHGTNEMDRPSAPAVDTGRSEVINGTPAEIYTWSGAYGCTATLWVATNFPNFAAIRPELYKVDAFNDTGPHRNAQPALSTLPGMVIKRENSYRGHTVTNTLVSVTIEPIEPAHFQCPPDYTRWTRPAKTE